MSILKKKFFNLTNHNLYGDFSIDFVTTMPYFCGMHLYTLKNVASIMLLVIAVYGRAQQTAQNMLSSQRTQLEEIRSQIETYKGELQQKETKESATLDMITALDREIDVASGLLKSLTKETKRYSRQITAREKEIAETEQQLDKLRKKFAKRLRHFYKHGRAHDLELLLNVKSFSNARIWLIYAKRVADNDRRIYKSILEKKQSLERNSDLLRLEIAEKRKAVEEKAGEEKLLEQSRRERQKYLKQLQKDKEFLRQRLSERERAAQQIGRLIIEAESQRASQERPKLRDTGANFAALKGRMLWPAQGNIVAHFGKQRHPELKTITENLGVEIKAAYGSAVCAVNDGEVWTITWQRGRGNIVIISHDNGYYTVYTHLAEIQVELHDWVTQGQVIGTVGDTGSLNGAVLHFQIWKNTTNLNPEDWLG